MTFMMSSELEAEVARLHELLHDAEIQARTWKEAFQILCDSIQPKEASKQ